MSLSVKVHPWRRDEPFFSLYRLQTIDTQRQKITQRIAQIEAELAADEAIKLAKSQRAG